MLSQFRLRYGMRESLSVSGEKALQCHADLTNNKFIMDQRLKS